MFLIWRWNFFFNFQVTYMQSFIAPKLSSSHRCKHPFFENDTFSTVYTFNQSNVTELSKCDYRMNNQSYKCNSWVFDHMYYQKTLTEQVKFFFNYPVQSKIPSNLPLFVSGRWFVQIQVSSAQCKVFTLSDIWSVRSYWAF